MADIRDLGDEDFNQFIRDLESKAGERAPTESDLAEILSDAMRSDDKKTKAQLYVELANLALAMADTTLGSQGSVATSVHLRIH